MKKIYIEPKNTVVSISLETLIANSPTGDVIKTNDDPITNSSNFGGREVIKTQDVWEEW